MRYILGLLCLLFANSVFAAASEGLKWTAITTYDDGSTIESTQKVVYLVYDAASKQVASTFAVTVPASALPADGCYTVRTALYAQATNSVVPNSQSATPSNTYCTKPAPPPQKRVATITDLGPAP